MSFDEFFPPKIPTHITKPKYCKRNKDREHTFSYYIDFIGLIGWRCDNCGKIEHSIRWFIDWDRIFNRYVYDMKGVDIVLFGMLYSIHNYNKFITKKIKI